MNSDRERLLDHLNGLYGAGHTSQDEIIRQMAEYDALVATKRMPLYALVSIIFAAISAMASAAAAIFAYLALKH